jgi:large subunit ribosomal protein L9
MKVILLKDIKGVGKRFEEKEIADGYANNFLIPKKMVAPLSGASAGAIKNLKSQEEKMRAEEAQILKENIAKLKGLKLSITAKANEKGHLFASLNASKIREFLKEKEGIEIPADDILLKEPIKEIGTFEVPISFEDKEINLSVEVTSL